MTRRLKILIRGGTPSLTAGPEPRCSTAKLKALLRKTTKRPIEALWRAIGCLLDDLTADERSHYLAHPSYGSI